MKILGIGNAIVDVICKVDDNFITQNNLTKSTMKLFFNESEIKSLLLNLQIEKTVSGGSVANSMVDCLNLVMRWVLLEKFLMMNLVVNTRKV